MSERKYSVGEIEALRIAVNNKWLFGSYNPCQVNGMMSRSYMPDEQTRAVEEMVRTHMCAGHTAQDLYASEQPPTNKSVLVSDAPPTSEA